MIENICHYTADAVDDDCIFTNQAIVAAGTLTLDGASVSSGTATLTSYEVGRYIAVTSAGDDTGIYFKITGKDQDGYTRVDNIAGASGSAAYSKFTFKTVTSIYVSGAAAGNVKIGTTAASTTYPIVGRAVRVDYKPEVHVSVSVSGFGHMVNSVNENYECIVPHTSDATTQPGVGSLWQVYWRKIRGFMTNGAAWVTPTGYLAVPTLTWTLQYTDEGFIADSQLRFVNSDDTSMVAVSVTACTTKVGNITCPTQWVRPIITAYTSGSIVMRVLQSE